ncbi:MAG: 6-bladed beta-propeller [Ginsengibacter sp.]
MKILLITFCFISCSIISIAQPITIRIDPGDAQGGTASQIFAEVNYIPLETTKESLFGKIDQLAVTEDYFIILDKATNSILIFKKDGKFHAKIKGSNLNMNSGKQIYSFNINPVTKQIGYQTSGSRHIFYYNFDGRKIDEKTPISSVYQYHLFPDNTIAYYNFDVGNRTLDSISHRVFITKDNKMYKEYLPFTIKIEKDKNNDGLSVQSGNIYEMGNDTSVFMVWPYDYTVYQLTPNSFTPRYSFVFPLANTLPEGFATDSLYDGDRSKSFQDNPNLIFRIGHTHLLGNNFFFNLSSIKNMIEGDPFSFIYNEKSGNLICIKCISPDSSNSFLPITDNGIGYDFSDSNFSYCDGKYVYTSCSSLAMFASKENTADKNPVYPTVLENYFKTESRKSNPVIVQLKPKVNL